MRTLLAQFVRDESGAAAIEYGLIAAGMSLAILTVLSGLGSSSIRPSPRLHDPRSIERASRGSQRRDRSLALLSPQQCQIG